VRGRHRPAGAPGTVASADGVPSHPLRPSVSMVAASRVGEAQAELVARVRAEIAAAADPERAVHQQAYMKSAMPFRGVPMPEVRRITKAALREHPLEAQAALLDAVTTLWDAAAYREERYAALTVLQVPKHRRWRDPTLLLLYEHLVLTGRWWDVVDDLATHAVGELLVADPGRVAPVIRRWAASDDLWLRRAALVSQVGARDRTDANLLADVIDAVLAPPEALSRDFFTRKGVGWALRDYARTDPVWVRSFVAAHAGRLSPLSIREATKHLPEAGATGE
jgi:3-methyladenine DNA glycosylase AlkD